jgi:hypothetical protein
MKKILRYLSFIWVILLSCLFTTVYSEDTESLVVTVQQGKLGAGGTAQLYQVSSGESIFISVGGNAQPPKSVQPPTVHQLRGEALSKAVQSKVTELQKKQYEYNSELYIVQKAPIELERQDLARQLHDLQNEQTKYNAQTNIIDTEKQKIGAQIAQQAPSVAAGVQVKPVLLEHNQLELQISGDQSQIIIKTALGAWEQIPGVAPETWVKVDLK